MGIYEGFIPKIEVERKRTQETIAGEIMEKFNIDVDNDPKALVTLRGISKLSQEQFFELSNLVSEYTASSAPEHASVEEQSSEQAAA